MNFDDIIVKESPGLCRCCLSEGCYKDLGTEYTWMNDTEIYADMLLDCFDIGITQHNDGPNGPKRLICEVCITRLRDACNFKKQVLDSEKRFIDMLGRGEFRPKVVHYQEDLKAETVEELLEDTYTSEVEYLDDIDYVDDVLVKTEDIINSTSQPSTSEDADNGPKPRKGRPRKQDIKPAKPAKIAKVAKDMTSIIEDFSALRKHELLKLYTVIIENSTVMPFRWHNNKYMCFYCGCPFNESTYLKEHNQSEHADMKIRSSFRSLLGNCKVKLEISHIKCKICSQEFPKLNPLIDHLQDAHNLKTNVNARRELFAYRLSEDKMVCEECGEKFQFFGTMLKHYHAFHNKTVAHICEICGMGFVAKANVAAHIKSVHSRTPCDKCTKENKAKCGHKPTRMIKCPKCPQILTSFYMKRRHMVTVHGETEYQFACDICPQKFPVRCRLVAHKQRVHLKVRSLACEICGYRAFDKDSLSRHMISHDDSRPFECDFCKKTFQRKKTLEFHRRIHTNDKRCVCNQCGKAFIQTASLKLHYRVHHPGGDWTSG